MSQPRGPKRREATAFVAVDAVVFVVLAVVLGGIHLQAMLALLAGSAFALLLLHRTRRDTGVMPSDDA
jgi:hypothetical protein